MPEQDRRACLSTYVLSAVVLGAIDRVKGTGKVGQPDDEEKASIERDLDLFIEFCNNRKIKPRELYECILAWADELAGMSHTEEAIRYFEKAEELGIRNYSDLFARLNLRKAELLCNAGRVAQAHGILSGAAERYFLILDKNLISAIIFLLGKTSLLTGQDGITKSCCFPACAFFILAIRSAGFLPDWLCRLTGGSTASISIAICPCPTRFYS